MQNERLGRVAELTYAVHALVEQRYHAALRFSEMVMRDPVTGRTARLQPDGPQPVTLADLREAMERVRAGPAMR